TCSLYIAACSVFLLLSFPTCRPPALSPFPYTTLFRSPADVGDTGSRGTARGPPQGRSRNGDEATGGAVAVSCGRLPRDTEVRSRSEEHTSELQSRFDLVCRLLLEKKN